MKKSEQPDNLESFFRNALEDYREDPGLSMWGRISASLPGATVATTTGSALWSSWMLLVAFGVGILLSGLVFYYYQQNHQLNVIETELHSKLTTIKTLEARIHQLEREVDQQNQQLAIHEQSAANWQQKALEWEQTEQMLTQSLGAFQENTIRPKSSGQNRFIKLTTARQPFEKSVPGVPQTTFSSAVGRLFLGGKSASGRTNGVAWTNRTEQLLFDKHLIRNTFFQTPPVPQKTVNSSEERSAMVANLLFLDGRPLRQLTFRTNNAMKTAADLDRLRKLQIPPNLFTNDSDVRAFINVSVNPLMKMKYHLAGYPELFSATSTLGIQNALNWSVNLGIEAKSRWSFQMGINYDALSLVREERNNIRFTASDATANHGGFVYGFNLRTDAALGPVVATSTVFNQTRGDGEDVLDGDLFGVRLTTRQPVRVIRLPILGGYRFDVARRFYITPKVGLSAVWKVRDRTQLDRLQTFSERISVQRADIFLTSKSTSEALEANLWTEFGFRYRQHWYLTAETRFRYGPSALFEYKNLALQNSALQFNLGIRYNIE